MMWVYVCVCYAMGKAHLHRKVLGSHRLPSDDGSLVSCVALSYCGNFAFVATASGRVNKFDIQTGRFRAAFQIHKGPITGLSADGLNTMLMT